VLVIHHEPQGAFGLVLTRRGDTNLATIWQESIHEPCPLDVPLMIGGPLEGPLLAVHANPGCADHEIMPGIYFTRHRDQIAAILAEESLPLRVFSGYSGWGSGQLEAELEDGSWGVTAATADFVFSDEATLWRRVTRRVADERLVEWLGVRDVPEEPWHN
jgi:putative transcriptional regulator